MRLALSSLLLLGLVAAHLVEPSSAGFILDKVGQTAKDVHEKVHERVEKLGTGIKSLFGGGGERDAESSESPPGEASSGSSTEAASTAGAGAGGSSSTTVDPRYVIGPIKRCNPGEQLFAGECRAAE